jgi:hypothetical protein
LLQIYYTVRSQDETTVCNSDEAKLVLVTGEEMVNAAAGTTTRREQDAKILMESTVGLLVALGWYTREVTYVDQ